MTTTAAESSSDAQIAAGLLNRHRTAVIAALGVLLLVVAGAGYIALRPAAGTSVDANVFFELDDSGSMDWETLTNEHDYYSNYWADNDVTGPITASLVKLWRQANA